MSTSVEIARLRPPAVSTARSPARARDLQPLRQILVCVDPSSCSDSCVAQAVAISKCLGGAMTLLHVVQGPQAHAGRATDALDWEISRRDASALLESLRATAAGASGGTVATRIEQGNPAERIAAVARELDADLTIIGAHGERDPTAGGLGGTAAAVLAFAHGSVFVARAKSDRKVIDPPQRILVPLDGSLRAESVLPVAARIATEHGAELLLVYVVCEPVATAVLFEPADLAVARDLAARLESSGKRYLEGLREQLVRDGATTRTVVLRSPDERRSILELCEQERSDLIVLSAHGSTCNPQLTTGSVTNSLLNQSSVALLVVQDLRGHELFGNAKNRSSPPPRVSYAEQG